MIQTWFSIDQERERFSIPSRSIKSKYQLRKQENNKQEEQTLTLNTEQTNIHKNNEPEQEGKIQSS